MILVKPSFEILNFPDSLRLIELAGRTCYKSESKIKEGSDLDFISGILKRGHESVIEHLSSTVRVICDRGVTHEIVRHRLFAYSQESTRYCNYSGEVAFVIPPWLGIPPGEYSWKDGYATKYTFNGPQQWFITMLNCEQQYVQLINECKWTPQQARSVLPNSLKTEIVMTANLREWRHFFKLRTSIAAHPQMREIACPMLEKFRELIPVVFDDIVY